MGGKSGPHQGISKRKVGGQEEEARGPGQDPRSRWDLWRERGQRFLVHLLCAATLIITAP